MSKQTFNQGACKFCETPQMVPDFETQEAADEEATLMCDCEEGEDYREKASAESDRLANRDDKLAAANSEVDKLFGDGAKKAGKESTSKEIVDYLKVLAEYVYDLKIRRATVKISDSMTATIFRLANGNIRIQRQDSSSENADI